MKKLLLVLITLSAVNCSISIAKVTNKQSAKHEVLTQSVPAPTGTFSQAITAGNTTYISGQIPVDPKTGNLVEGEFKDRVKQVFQSLGEIAKASGGSLDDVVKLTAYVTDIANVPVINEVMKEYFHPPFPARAIVEVKGLAKGADLEIEAILVKRSNY